MPEKEQETSKNGAAAVPTCLGLAQKGIKTGTEFAGFMSALLGDLASGAISPQVGNAMCNTGGKLLKVVEMQHRYGLPAGQKAKKVLDLVEG